MKQKQIMNGLAVLVLAGMLSACSSFYQSVVTVTEVRDEAMKELVKLRKQGIMDDATYVKLENADARYLSAAKIAHRALVAYKNGGDRAAYVAALTLVKEAVGELLAILNPLNTNTANKLEVELAKASKP